MGTAGSPGRDVWLPTATPPPHTQPWRGDVESHGKLGSPLWAQLDLSCVIPQSLRIPPASREVAPRVPHHHFMLTAHSCSPPQQSKEPVSAAAFIEDPQHSPTNCCEKAAPHPPQAGRGRATTAGSPGSTAGSLRHCCSGLGLPIAPHPLLQLRSEVAYETLHRANGMELMGPGKAPAPPPDPTPSPKSPPPPPAQARLRHRPGRRWCGPQSAC